jgi:hypothetical protein
MLAGEISSTRSKQTFEIGNVDVPLNTTTGLPYHFTQFSLRYKGSISVDWGDGNKSYVYSTYSVSPVPGHIEYADRYFSHTYSVSYSGVIKIKGNINSISYVKMFTPTTATMSQIKKLTSLEEFHCGNSSLQLPGIANDIWSFDVNNLPNQLKIFDIPTISYTHTNLYGTVSSATVFPTNLTYMQIGGTNVITGDIKWFFGTTASIRLPNLTTLIISGSNRISGDISGILRASPTMSVPVDWVSPDGEPYWWHQIGDANAYPTLTDLRIYGSNTVTGDITWFTYLNLTNIEIEGTNTVYGDIIGISFITNVNIKGSNKISGDLYGLSNIPALPGLVNDNVKYLRIEGSNTVYGDIISLPVSIKQLYITGRNTITGNIGNLSSSLELFVVDGNNSGGTFAPAYSYNTIYGDIGDLSAISNLANTLTAFVVGGRNTITGDIGSLTSLSNLRVFSVYGNNSVYGNIANLPPSLNRLNVINTSGNIYGDISTQQYYDQYGILQGIGPNLETFYINATNSVTGNIADLSGGSIYYFYLAKNTTKLTYTSITWEKNQISELYLYPNIGAGLTTDEVDNLLIDLAGSDGGTINIDGGAKNGARIFLNGNNAAHSSLSNEAINILRRRACTVAYN